MTALYRRLFGRRPAETRRRLTLALVAVPLALLIGGPTPGSVGGCSSADSLADPEVFCEEVAELECAREELVCMRPMAMCVEPEGDYDICVAAIDCAGVTFNNCPRAPSQQQAEACKASLQQFENVGTPYNEIPACIQVCP
jgi:hypothetical protein